MGLHWQLFAGFLAALSFYGCPSSGQNQVKEIGGTSQVFRLRRQLRSTEVAERLSAAQELGQMGEKAEKAIPSLQQALLDSQQSVQLAAVKALGQIGAKAVPALLYARNRPSPEMSKAATAAINRLGPERLQALIAALKSPLRSVRIQASGMLGDMGPAAAEAVSPLSKLVKDEDTDVRIAGVQALQKIGPAGAATPNVVMALGMALKANKMWWNVRVAIAKTLGSFGAKGAGAAPELVPLLSDRDNNVNQAAFKAFLQIGPTTVTAMDRGYVNAPWEGKVKIAQIVEQFGPKAAAMVNTLAQGLLDSDTDVRKATLRALAKIGPPAQPALPRLTRFLSTPRVTKDNWLGCLRVMLNIGDQGILALNQLLEGNDWELRKKIVEGLGQLGASVGGQGVPVLVTALQHKEKEVQWIAAMVLRKLKHQASGAIPTLIQTLEAKDATTRKLSAKALGAIGAAAKSAIPALKKRFSDGDASVQQAAREAIATIENPPKSSKTKPKARELDPTDPDAPVPPRK